MRKLIGLMVMLMAALPLAAEKKVIVVPELGAANPNFSAAMLVDGTLYVSGQIGRDVKTGQVPADFDAEVKTVLGNIGIVLKAAGMTYKDVVSVQVYLTDMELFAKMNAVYVTYFPEPRPTRTTVGVTKLALPNARIEITVTAKK